MTTATMVRPTTGATRVLGGVTVLDTARIREAMALVHRHSPTYLYNHAVRSWLFAVRLGQLRGLAVDDEVVAIGTLLHDLGLTPQFKGPRRFEVIGADAARHFAEAQGIDGRRTQLIWDGVALNSTPSIGLFKEAEVALITAGVVLDFGGPDFERFPPDEMRTILAAFPRLDMKRQFTDAICRVCAEKPETTYDNFAGDFGERFVPGYHRPSIVDFMMNGPFDE